MINQNEPRYLRKTIIPKDIPGKFDGEAVSIEWRKKKLAHGDISKTIINPTMFPEWFGECYNVDGLKRKFKNEDHQQRMNQAKIDKNVENYLKEFKDWDWDNFSWDLEW